MMFIGIAGGTGSGKSTLTRKIAERFGDHVAVLSHDDYYRAQDELTYEQRLTVNYDHPDAFETSLLTEHLDRLRAGEAVEVPVYDFSVYNRTKNVRRVCPTGIILVEGILLFACEELCKRFDLRVFVDADADVRILRRLLRDVRKRGRTPESVANQYLETVKPMHEQFVEPSRRRADIIVPQGGKNQAALELIEARIADFLRTSGRAEQDFKTSDLHL